MDWPPNTSGPPPNTISDNSALTNAINAFVNAIPNLQQTTTPTTPTNRQQVLPQQHNIAYQKQPHIQQYQQYQYQQYQQQQQRQQQQQQQQQYLYNNNINNNNEYLINKIGNMMNDKLNGILKENINKVNEYDLKYNDDDDDDDDDDDVHMIKLREKKKKKFNKKRGVIKTSAFFKRKVLWTAVNKQTASSVKLAPLLGSKVDIVLSTLSYWKKRGLLQPHGHNGYKLINGLKLDNVDVENGFIKRLINEFERFEWMEYDEDEDDDDDDDDSVCEYFKDAAKAAKELSAYGK